jgi:hypothetical protein
MHLWLMVVLARGGVSIDLEVSLTHISPLFTALRSENGRHEKHELVFERHPTSVIDRSLIGGGPYRI